MPTEEKISLLMACASERLLRVQMHAHARACTHELVRCINRHSLRAITAATAAALLLLL
jgi:hypothetical protein|eukprot:COSAG06_NODE_3024_length_5947_cov_2.441689_2_plen_59_part_00